MPETIPTFADLAENFALLDDWEDRYRYIIDLGRTLPPLPEADHIPANKVEGCMSQVWLTHHLDDTGRLRFKADSDAHIVRGLVAIMLIILGDKTPAQTLATDVDAALAALDLDQHISPNRRNGVASVAHVIKATAAGLVQAT